jgi:hypothetical protein
MASLGWLRRMEPLVEKAAVAGWMGGGERIKVWGRQVRVGREVVEWWKMGSREEGAATD